MESRSEPHRQSRRRAASALVLVVVLLAGGVRGVPDANAAKEASHCINSTGLDLNEFYGVSHEIVAAFCPQVGAGWQWTPASRWLVGEDFAVVPDGFVPAGATPLEDFIAKFVAVKYVVDPGTAQEQTYAFPNDGVLFTGTQFGLVLVSPITLGALHPLSVGEHVVEVSWVFSSMHCDGVGVVIPDNCLPAGELLFVNVLFEVTPGHYI